MDDEQARRREINDVMRHELRTRVGIGNGYLAMLLTHHDALTPQQRAAALHGLSEAFARLDAFGRRVLMDEKLETREVRAQRGEVALAALVERAVRPFPGVVVDTEDAPDTVYVDPVLAGEILDNLLANAVTASPPGTHPTLRVRAADGAVRFEVRDDGEGVTEADRAVLWQRFGRTERSRSAGTPGMGLGLSIIRRMAEAHDGRYGVETGEGTTFWVELPVSP